MTDAMFNISTDGNGNLALFVFGDTEPVAMIALSDDSDKAFLEAVLVLTNIYLENARD